jgi:FtsP/CotA-like multicopper oxidase with cupredoxin domain
MAYLPRDAAPGLAGAPVPAIRSEAEVSDEWRPGAATRFAAGTFGTGALLLIGVLLFAVWHSASLNRLGPVASAAPVAVANAAAPGAVKEFTLEAKEVDWDLLPGTTVKAWTFNGQMPGPEIHVAEGDTVRVTLKNSLPVPTTIHWHGVDVPNNMDGVPGMTQDAVPPGGTFTYEFTATNPGTRWYHSHQDPEIQVPLGLFGPLIIDPKTPPPGEPKFDRDYTYILSEWSLALTPDVAEGNASLPASGPGTEHSKELDFDHFLMNGKVGDAIAPLTVKAGERVRIRLINAGSLMHVMHTHGHSFKVIALDGNPLTPAQQYVKDSVTIGPSERVDIELDANNPGVWMFHCHIEHHMANGMMTTIRYEGVATTHDSMAAAPQTVSATGPLLSAADPKVAAAAMKITMVDNRFQPGDITVPVGTTVAWINRGANVHTVSAFDGSFESGSITPGQAFVYTFSKPGVYQFLCRQHFLNGMSGKVTVQ